MRADTPLQISTIMWMFQVLANQIECKRPLSPPMLNARNDRSLDFLMRKSDGVIDGLDQSYRSMAA